MKMSDEKQISADRETVWNALTSPDVLKECVPGAQDVTGSPEEGFEATVTQKVGPVKATFKGTVTFSEMEKPEKLTLTGEGKGGAAGFAKKMADQFFTRLEEVIEGPKDEDEEAEAEKKGWLKRLIS